MWEKQRETVLRELDAIGCVDTPIVELWNKIDQMPDAEDIRLQVGTVGQVMSWIDFVCAQAATLPVDVEAVVMPWKEPLPADRGIGAHILLWLNTW